jgi:hypothetical protein
MNPFLNLPFANLHTYQMLFNHSRFLGQSAVTVVQAALP